MKIGIMTFWWSEDNYGQLLQCYALQKYLRDQGHDAYLIRYDPRNDFKKSPLFLRIFKAFNPFKLYNYIKQQKNIQNSLIEQRENPRNFEEFRSKYIIQSEKIYTSYEQLKEFPPIADMYIVGSDQVWNFNRQKLANVKNVLHAYFLDFGSTETKRVSYAASWSVNTIRKDIADEIFPLLKKFNFISVREKAGLKLCEELGLSSEWTPDPTFLLESEIYRNLYKSENFPPKHRPYLFLYILSNRIDYSINNIYSWAKNNNLDIVYITGNNCVDNNQKVYATIPQWLWLLDNATYVITNSFHCCVFSIIFQKQFAVIPLEGLYSGMNSRLDSLWEITQVEPRFFNKNNISNIKKIIDYKSYNVSNSSIDKIINMSHHK